jgi:hypothetical protein
MSIQPINAGTTKEASESEDKNTETKIRVNGIPS